MGQPRWLVRRDEPGTGRGNRSAWQERSNKELEWDDDHGGDNEAEEDSSERYKSDYGNEDDSSTRGADH